MAVEREGHLDLPGFSPAGVSIKATSLIVLWTKAIGYATTNGHTACPYWRIDKPTMTPLAVYHPYRC